jgi:hypothetical protein
MLSIDAGDRHVTDDLVALDSHQVDRPEQRLGVGDGVRDACERLTVLWQMQAHREAVRGGRLEPRAWPRAQGLVGHGSDHLASRKWPVGRPA